MVSAGYVGKATITIKTSGNIYYKASSKKITVTVKDPVREQDRVQAVPQAAAAVWQGSASNAMAQESAPSAMDQAPIIMEILSNGRHA